MSNPTPSLPPLEDWDDKLPQMISDLVWSVTDGGQKIEPKLFLSYQEEPVREYEDIKDFVCSLLSQARKETEEKVWQMCEEMKTVGISEADWDDALSALQSKLKPTER